MTGKEWVPPHPSPCSLNTGCPKEEGSLQENKTAAGGGVKQHNRERGCFPNSNINSSTENTGIAFRWTMAIHIFVQFLPQSGCDKVPANASSEYNLTAA